ncbi:PaaI family thioesterase [Roseomonas sp. CCTCC AB2023176]|uniref:PaaI family thioesterase n=1 Tax=Roseomonas sp. CCTCC AB2023176 TaxID=3342640 RepID=UPI0035DE5800
MTQQHGFFHGGAIGALADVAGGYAAMTAMAAAADVLSLEYKINFLRPAIGERLLAEGLVLRSGRSVTVVRVDVHAERNGARALCAASQQSVVAAPG